MTVDAEEKADATMPASDVERGQALAAVLRGTAQRAAERVGGGVAIVFGPGAKLRAAAGFANPESARAAAMALLPLVQEAMHAGDVRRGPAPELLGPRGAGGVNVVPMAFDGRVVGALATAGPTPIGEGAAESLSGAAALAAAYLEHARIEGEATLLRDRLAEREKLADQKSDEILKLSETLFAQDIELLRNQEKLGKIEKLKNDFIEKMSRELRTPLNAIIEAIISVLANENESLSDAAKAGLRSALDDGTAFLRTLQNILDLWRIKQGEMPVEIQDVSFREVVDEAIFSVQETIGDKEITIQTRFAEPFPKIRTDLAKLNQILFLILDNAGKFTPAGKIEIRGAVRDGRLECEIEDSGIGICPDDQQFLFDEFFQVDELQSNRYRGAGLGLTLVRDLLTLLEGELSLTSEVGRGTLVRFHLPVQVAG
jgi:signal transduction histidine kinase